MRTKTVSENCVDRLKEEWKKEQPPKDRNLANRLTTDFNQILDKLRQRITKQIQQRTEGLEHIEQWMETFQSDLDSDNISNAGKLYHKIEAQLAELPAVPSNTKQSIHNRLLDFRPKLKHLEGWRHWGTDKARETLIEEAVQLAASTTGVKERIKTLKQLRERWRKLGKIDPKSAHSLWQQFDSACNKAFEPVAEERKKENSLRDENLEKRKEICQQLESIEANTNWKEPNWREVDKTISQLRNQWRSTGPVRHNRWNKINQRFNDAIDQLNTHLENERRICRNRRLRLIEQMQAIKPEEDLSRAIETAKNLQKQWQPTVLGRRSEEQKLWKQFRAAADIVFARDKEQRKEVSRENSEQRKAKESICMELESILSNKTDQLAPSQGKIAKLKTQWEELGDSNDRSQQTLRKRYEKALANIDKELNNQALDQTRRLLKSLLNGEGDQKADSADPEMLNSYLLEIEIIMEIDSPQNMADERMRLQVERLADNMGRTQQDSHIDEVMILAQKVSEQRNAGVTIEGLQARIDNIIGNSQKLS